MTRFDSHYSQDRTVQTLSDYVTKTESLPFIQKGFPVKVSPKVNKTRLCFNMIRFPGETTTVSKQTLCTRLSAAELEERELPARKVNNRKSSRYRISAKEMGRKI